MTCRTIPGYQILGSTSWSIDYVAFPGIYDRMVRRLNSLTLFEFAIGIPAACIDPDVDAHRRLLFQTLGPVAVALVLLLVYGRAVKDSSPAARERLRHYFAYGILLVAYMLLPSTSSTLFDMFNCNDCKSLDHKKCSCVIFAA